MDNTLQELLGLVEKGTVEQRCAGFLVLGALKAEGGLVVKAVTHALNDPNPVVKEYALRYFEQAAPKSAATSLVALLDDADRDIQDRAIHLLTQSGRSAVQPVLQKVSTGSRVWQLNAARVLCAVGGRAAWKAPARHASLRQR